MIYFNNVGVDSNPHPSNRTVVYADITFDKPIPEPVVIPAVMGEGGMIITPESIAPQPYQEIYKWTIYVPAIKVGLTEYLATIANRIEADILAKEALWLTVPHTRTIPSFMGQGEMTVDIDKSEVVRPNLPEEEDWEYPEYVKRIIAPMALIMDNNGIKMYGWFSLNKLPITTKDDKVRMYCNVILPQHQALIASFGNLISVEEL